MAMRSHAVVVGASMAGLLAARSLLDHYERVTIVDRDDIPSRPQPRGGVPQGRHAHGLLAEGRTILEEMFPGLTSDLTGSRRSPRRRRPRGRLVLHAATAGPPRERADGAARQPLAAGVVRAGARRRQPGGDPARGRLRARPGLLGRRHPGGGRDRAGPRRRHARPAPRRPRRRRDGAGVADAGVARTARVPRAGRGGPSRRQALHDLPRPRGPRRLDRMGDGGGGPAGAAPRRHHAGRGGRLPGGQPGRPLRGAAARRLARVPGLGRHPLLVTAGRRAGRAGAAGRRARPTASRPTGAGTTRT